VDNENSPDVCPVIVTASADVSTAIEAMKLGAYDYLTKPFPAGRPQQISVSIMRKDKDNEEKKRVIELEQTITKNISTAEPVR
jgi:DNA-binding NtrC family response regulator